MAEVDISADGANYLANMKASRERPAVLKTNLTALRASLPTALIFAFEGIEDKTIYFSWIARISPKLRYEPFCCNGKTQLLELVEVIKRDLNDLGNGVYFFLDRDFDDLRGNDTYPKLFMTTKYSVENYLVNSKVFEEILKNEFHCHAQPELREPILKLFDSVYFQFLRETKPANWRLFQARRVAIELIGHLPDKISKIAHVTLESVSLNSDTVPNIVLRMTREPTSEESSSLAIVFEELEPQARYRGKFALLFFQKWLSLIAEDRNSSKSKYFGNIQNSNKANYHEISLGSLAAKSDLPDGLETFVSSVIPPKNQ
jgi:hypothetical protein